MTTTNAAPIAVGWDLGGAHVKAARFEGAALVAAAQYPCPLWRGIDALAAALEAARPLAAGAGRHAVTMTGELCDIFDTHAAGVAALCAAIRAAFPDAPIAIYAGARGLVPLEAAVEVARDVASANWRASAEFAATAHPAALFVDIGSTTTDLIPIVGGRIAARGVDDASRLAAGELVYSGLTRTPVMAVARRVPFMGVWTPLMNELFATMGDAHRVLGAVPEGADVHDAADGRGKSRAESVARLARMVGRDVADAPDAAWAALAETLAEAQLRSLHDAAALALSAPQALIGAEAPVIGAGIGRGAARRLADRLGRAYVDFGALIVASSPAVAGAAADNAPAVAMARLAARDAIKSTNHE